MAQDIRPGEENPRYSTKDMPPLQAAFLNYLKGIPADFDKRMHDPLNVVHMAEGMSPLRTEVVDPKADTLKKMLQFLMNKYPEGFPTKLETIKNDNEAFKTLGITDPTIYDNSYVNAIRKWLVGDAKEFRSGEHALSEKLGELLQASPNVTKNTLWRASGLGEIPNQKIGEVFSNPFLSFTRNRNMVIPKYTPHASTELLNGKVVPKSIIALESGAKSLPVAGISSFTKELEHIVGGDFKITDIKDLLNERKLVRIKQITK